MINEWPAENLERVECCPVCGNKDRRHLYSGLTDRVFNGAPGYWDLYQCGKCRSVYLDPRPTQDTISLAYIQYYTHEKPKRQDTKMLPGWRRYVRALANGYRNRSYGGNLQPESILGHWLIPLLPRLRHALDQEVRYLPKYKPGARLLDIGFGSGHFLNIAKRIGWQVTGADPDPIAVSNGLSDGLDVRRGGIENFADANEEFDVITLNHVIEHVHDPIDTLKLAFDLLKPGGTLYLETPNIDACGHKDFKQHWRGLEIPRHLVIFNWASMIKSLDDVGFNVLDKKYNSFSSYASLASASRAIREEKNPYSIKNKMWRDTIKEYLLRWSPFTDKDRSEFITIIAKKPDPT